MSTEGKVDGLLDEVERDVLKIAEERIESTSMSMKDLVHKAINTIEEYLPGRGC